MKIFEVEPHVIKYYGSDGAFHPIQDIAEDDILGIVGKIIDSEEIETDPVPDSDKGYNPAALVIYKELHKQFSAISNSRDDTIRRINSEFAEAEAYYDGEGAGNLLESHDENVWDE